MCSESPKLLGNTKIRAEDVQVAFREHFNDNSLALTVDEAETIAQGQGFTSIIVRLTLTWTSNGAQKPADLPRTAILKALGGKAMEELWAKLIQTDNPDTMNYVMNQAHDGECLLYRTFKQHSPAPVPVPIVYAAWDSKTASSTDRQLLILMEDLGDRARVLGDPTDVLDYDQLKNILSGLVDIHVWSLRNPELLDPFDTIIARIAAFKEFEPIMIKGLQGTKLAHPTIFETIDENKIIELIRYDNALERMLERQVRFPDVLIHGDCWANNIMFEKLPDGSMGPKIVAFIDWQGVLKGNLGSDFGRLLSISCSPELQEEKYDELKKFYYDTLVEKVGKDKLPKELTWEAVSQIIDEETAFNGLMMLFMQDVMQGLFAPTDGPESEKCKEKMVERCRYGVKFASKILDIKK